MWSELPRGGEEAALLLRTASSERWKSREVVERGMSGSDAMFLDGLSMIAL